ncbi:MAG TPA: hypothetical protein DIU37_04890 [Opitutae bacterium]|nr:hypothetical protein [Opitutae bacterium]|tara:strand:- start:751 stop:1206 length:456 start_codon:yes stop_codon:yes gene_type:complete
MGLDLVQLLFKQLGESMQMPGLALDGEAYCCIAFDDQVLVEFQWVEKTQRLILFTRLGTFDMNEELRILRLLLRANCFWRATGGGTLGMDGDYVYLSYAFMPAGATYQQFHNDIERFVHVAEFWEQNLHEGIEGFETEVGGALPQNLSWHI